MSAFGAEIVEIMTELERKEHAAADAIVAAAEAIKTEKIQAKVYMCVCVCKHIFTYLQLRLKKRPKA
jgi:hypothetical protein